MTAGSDPWEVDRPLSLEAARAAIAASFPGIDVRGLVHLGSGWEFDAFLTGAAVASVAYFFLVSSLFEQATTVASDAVSGGAATSEGAKAGAAMGKTFGIFVAVMVFLETIIAGIGGAVAGGKVRGQGGLSALSAMAKSAR